MTALVVTAPLAIVISWGTMIGRGLSDGVTGLLMVVDLVLAVLTLIVLPHVLHRDSGPPTWAVDEAREQRALRWGLLVIACSAFSGGALLPALVAMVSLSARRRPRWIAAAVLTLAGVFVVGLLFEVETTPAEGQFGSAADLLLVGLTGLGLAAVLVLTGLYRGSRRALLHSLRREAKAARVGEQARADQARSAERTRIAREMHDTVSHRLALVALYAGGLEYRDDLTPEQVRETMGVIRQGVADASEELRSTLAVLRSDGGDAAPPPTLVDLQRVIEEVRRAGTQVHANISLPPDHAPPPTVIAHLHRVVQESLTNALKHAPGQPITVSVDGAVGDGIRVTVCNPLPTRGTGAAGSRVGLIGLRERASLVGGRFDAGVQGDDFVVQAWVPWQS